MAWVLFLCLPEPQGGRAPLVTAQPLPGCLQEGVPLVRTWGRVLRVGTSGVSARSDQAEEAAQARAVLGEVRRGTRAVTASSLYHKWPMFVLSTLCLYAFDYF